MKETATRTHLPTPHFKKFVYGKLTKARSIFLSGLFLCSLPGKSDIGTEKEKMREPVIQIATAEDIPAIEKLVNSAYRGDSSRKGWTTEADLLGGQRTNAASLLEMMQEPGAVIVKYTGESGMLEGCVYLKQKANTLYLGMLTVSPELQAKGIGRKMLAAAEQHARLLGCKTITMTVISVRSELIAWYERNGYSKTGATEPFPTDPKFGLPKQPLHFIVMEKLLV